MPEEVIEDVVKPTDEETIEQQKSKSKKRTRFYKSPVFKSAVKIILIVTVVVSLLLNLFTLIMPIVKYYGESMSPSLKDGQILIVSKLSEIKSGDIIAFYYNNKVIVRRVIAEGNDQVAIDVFGKITVNGNDIDEPYVENQTLGQCNLKFPYSVPSGSYFVLGDNRDISMDSRLSEIGVVTEDRLIGKVIFSLNPFKTVD